MDNTKDAFIWLKDNYSSLTESEYTELVAKWGKLKVYCPIITDETSFYELNELSYVNGEWSFEVLSTESDESKLNGDYPIIPKSETTKDDNDWTKWASYMETQVTESGAVKDETVCEPNGAEVVELTEEEIAKLNGTTEESTDDGISEEEIISTNETVEDSSEIVSDVAEDSTVDEESAEEVTESTEESSESSALVEETTDIVEETTADEVEENADVVEVDNVAEETTEQESSDVIEDISDTVTENVSDEVVDTTEQESTETTDENSTVEESTNEVTEENTDTVENAESTEESTVIEENNLEETTENVTN